MSGNSHDARSVFIAALALNTPGERSAYLDEACKGDPELRSRVEKLLSAHEQADDFLAVDESDGIMEGPGTVIDHYKLLEEIGEGGFGVVFMAEQVEPIRRKVALKIVKPGMDTKQVVARFEAERQALALMDHPNIAHVFDAGTTETGRPYFVMELVHGVPITEFCDDNELTAEARLKLFVTVCEAVQHAHQKGIIHRDLKPSNILVTLHDGNPVSKVIDFGTAKAVQQPLTERTMFTAYGKLVGTPQYMSPEQVEMSGLDVDTRADIFSLGVLLYELLTGTTPFEAGQLRAAPFDEMMRMIREEDPPKPSTRISTLGARASDIAQQRQLDPDRLRRSLRGDLDWIVMKALEKDRQRRYETAIAFAQDLKRHLGHEPVSAGQPSMAYRSRKFLRRHRTASLVIGGIGITLLAGVIVSSIGFLRATAEAERAAAEAEHARQQEATAEAIFLFIRDDLLQEDSMVGGGFMDDVPLHTAIDWAANTVDRRFSEQPLVQIRIHLLLFHFYFDRLDFQKGFTHAEKAVRLAAEHLEPAHRYRVEANRRLMGAFMLQQRHAEAEQHIKRELEIAEKKYGPEHLNIAAYLDLLAELYSYQKKVDADFGPLGTGELLKNILPGRYDEVESLYQRALGIRVKTLGSDHPDIATSIFTQITESGFGYYLEEEDNGKFEELVDRILKIREDALGSEHPAVAEILDLKAKIYEEKKQYKKAEQLMKRAMSIRQKAFGEESPEAAQDIYWLARFYNTRGRSDMAGPLYEEALRINENVYGADHPKTISRRSTLAVFYKEQEQFDKAEQLYELVLEITEQTLGMEHHQTQFTISGLAGLYKQRGKFEEAELLYKRDLESREKKLESARNSMPNRLRDLAYVYNVQGKYADAVPLLERAVAIQKDMRKPDDYTLLGYRNELAGNFIKQERYTEAESLYEQTLNNVRDKPYSPAGPWPYIYYGTDAMGGLALTYIEEGKYGQAEPLLKEAQNLLDHHIRKPQASPFLAEKMTFNLTAYAKLYLAQKQYEEAEAYVDRALEIWKKIPGPDHPDVAEPLEQLAAIYRTMERDEEAAALEQRAARIRNAQEKSNRGIETQVN